MKAMRPGAWLRHHRSFHLSVTGLVLLSIVGGLLALQVSQHPAYAAGNVQINAGGAAASPFVADTDFSGGTTASTPHAITTTGVTNPTPQAVYQSNRYGNFTYTIPNLTANASYTVRLHFAETYWTAAAKRIFNVSINGNQVLSNFDIFATAGGEYIAVVEQFSATASSSGSITIQFTTVTDNAQVNGIDVLSGGGSSGTPNFGPNVYIFDPSMSAHRYKARWIRSSVSRKPTNLTPSAMLSSSSRAPTTLALMLASICRWLASASCLTRSSLTAMSM
ncbi:MAG TPA: malectin [Ktedonobacterales bacterium]|nr:malectin [Ktedonobacterales bacterium]